MTIECTTSTLPAIGSPIIAPVAKTVSVGRGARRVHRAYRGVRRIRRAAAVLVTCVSVGGLAAAAPAIQRYYDGGSDGWTQRQLTPVAPYEGTSVIGPTYLPLITGYPGLGRELPVGYAPGGYIDVPPIHSGPSTDRPPTSVPEPWSISLFATGLAAMAFARLRRR